MQPIPIPDEWMWEQEGKVVRRMTIGAPSGSEEICRPVEALVDRDPEVGWRRYSMLVELEPGDLERLGESGRFWLHVYGDRLQPFSMTVP